MVVVLLNTLLLSLSAGMFVSSISRQPDRAMVGTLVLVSLLAVVPAGLDRLLLEDLRPYGIAAEAVWRLAEWARSG